MSGASEPDKPRRGGVDDAVALGRGHGGTPGWNAGEVMGSKRKYINGHRNS